MKNVIKMLLSQIYYNWLVEMDYNMAKSWTNLQLKKDYDTMYTMFVNHNCIVNFNDFVYIVSL